MTRKSAFRATLATSVMLVVLPTAAVAQDADVSGDEGDIVVTGQRQAYRGDVPVKDTPQSIQVLDSELLTDLNISSLDGALALASGVARQNNFGGLWDAFAIRGFAGDENFPSGFLVNGFNGGRGYGGPRDASNIERMEVLKGPNGSVFGRGEPGGTINIITKKADARDSFGSAAASIGSFNAYRIEADFNIALSDRVAFRLNGAGERSDGFRDFLNTKKIVASPSIMLKPTDTTSITYEMEFVDQKVPFDRGVPAINGKLGQLPISLFVGEPGDGPIEVDVLGHQVQIEQRLGGNWVALGGFGYRDTSFTGFGTNAQLGAARQIIDNDGMNLSRERRFRDYNTENMVFRGEVSGNLYTGNVKHHVLVGADWDRFTIDLLQTRFRPNAYTPGAPIINCATPTTPGCNNAINVFNPVYGQLPTPTATLTNTLEKQTSYGVYFQDQIDITDTLKLRVGGRYDHFKQYVLNRSNNAVTNVSTKRFSPTAGLLYQVTDTVGLYAAYGTGFRPNGGLNINGNPFSPEISDSYEVGIRYTSDDKMINGTVAVFTMTKDNILTQDGVSGFSVTTGAARSRGLEADLNARLPSGFSIYATYAYTDTEWTTSSVEFGLGAPVLPGDPLLNIPKHNANLVVSKDFDVDNVGHFSLGAGINYVSKRLGETGTNFFIPGYTLVKLTASYEPSDTVKLSLVVNNLLDKTWYANSYAEYWVAPGAPRSVTAKASFSF
jgi:iron complex outermembrane recepter protein